VSSSDDTCSAGPTGPTGNEEVLRRLDDLTDLFRRRLQDDRDKRRLIDELSERLRAADTGPFRQYLLPFMNGIAVVLDRLARHDGPDAEFTASIRAELLELLASHAVTEVPTSGPFDPAHHTVISSRQDLAHPPGTVIDVDSCGLTQGSWVFRPARVIVSAPRDSTLEGQRISG
jgi:molecular chaperone GrpE (heat shock protein)